MSLEWPLESLSDDEVLRGLARHLSESRRSEAGLLAHLAEVEARRLFAREAAPSMFVYCTRVLHLSEAEAYLRIAVARAARRHPVLLAMLADGRLHISGIALLAPHLTRENREPLLFRAAHKTKREIEELLAEQAPRPDVPAVLRKLPDRPTLAARPEAAEELRLDGVGEAALGPDGVPAPEVLGPGPEPRAPSPALVQPLSPGRYRVQFTAGVELRDKLERLRALLRHEVPDGDIGAIIDRAVTEKLERLEARRFACVKAPRKDPVRRDSAPSSRYLPAAVRRAVFRRDKGQCRFVDGQGRRCPERHRLEYHHRWPYGLGGGADVNNIGLMCRTHNRLMAEIDYGRKAIARRAEAVNTRGPAPGAGLRSG
jgi:hypothetical protein